MALPTTPRKPDSVQPGGGWCMGLELAWGRFRRALLRRFRPNYVRRMREKRQGSCREHDADVIDARDLKYLRNVCGFGFRPEDDRFQWRSRIGLARYGLAEVVVFTFVFVLLGSLLSALAVLGHWAIGVLLVPLLLLWLEIIYFFRDPERVIPEEADALVSPADGTVTNVEGVDDRAFAGGHALSV